VCSSDLDLFSKKEVARYERERKKLEKSLSGIKEMGTLPDALFVVDTNMESIAIKEAVKLGIPIIGVADTKCNPDVIDYIIPGNDDALRSIRLVTDTIAQAYIDGRLEYEARQKELAAQREKERQLQVQQAAAAREAAAARNAETAEAGTSDAQSTQDKSAAKPRTTVRKTLQRKPKVKKTEGAAEIQSEAQPVIAAEEPAASEPETGSVETVAQEPAAIAE
jgi:small subunit ribosomal protein S2